MVADAFLEKEYVILTTFETILLTLYREKMQAAQVFSHVFSWSEAIDAAADVYNGVRSFTS